MFLARAPDGHLYFTAASLQQPDPLWHYLLVPQAWTLSIELTFYLMAPVLNRLRTRTLLMLVSASIVLRAFLWKHWGLTYDPWTDRFFPNEIAFFLIGMLQYRAYIGFFRRLPPVWCASIAYPFVFGTMLAFQHLPKVAGVPAFYGATIALIPVLFQASRRSSVDRWVGELSYPIYVVHFLLMRLALGLIPALSQDQDFGLFLSIGSIAAAALMQMLIIRPIERVRQGRVRDHRRAAGAPPSREPAPPAVAPAPLQPGEAMAGAQAVPGQNF
jgi:peptidoglycan/LPS O-acetylase OafA/YrhL